MDWDFLIAQKGKILPCSSWSALTGERPGSRQVAGAFISGNVKKNINTKTNYIEKLQVHPAKP